MIRFELQRIVQSAVDGLGLPSADYDPVEIVDTKQPEHGDYACNFALIAAKKAGMNPRELGEKLKDALLPNTEVFSGVEVAGPGFVNLRLQAAWVAGFVSDVLAAGEQLAGAGQGRDGLADHGRDTRATINVEFVSVNPNGPITIGSGRGAAYGSTLANVLEAAGNRVQREYYINDGVNSEQMRLFAESLEAAFGQLLGWEVKDESFHYRGEYVNALADRLLEESVLQMKGEDWAEARRTAQASVKFQHIMASGDPDGKWDLEVDERKADQEAWMNLYESADELLSGLDQLRCCIALINLGDRMGHLSPFALLDKFVDRDGLDDAPDEYARKAIVNSALLIARAFPEKAASVFPDDVELRRLYRQALIISNVLIWKGIAGWSSVSSPDEFQKAFAFVADALLRSRAKTFAQKPVSDFESDYIIRAAAAFVTKTGDVRRIINNPDPVAYKDQLREFAQSQMLEAQRGALSAFGVEFDTWFSEQSLHEAGKVKECINHLVKNGAADESPIRHKLKLAKGGKIEEVEVEAQSGDDEDAAAQGDLPTLWLRSTKFGDDMDRVLRRRDGRLTYIASDVAYHKDKLERTAALGPNPRLITILGPDHHGYIGRLQAVLAAQIRTEGEVQASAEPLSEVESKLYANPADRDACRAALDEARQKLEVQIYQLVRFLKDGKPAPMRKRDGNIYALIDLIDEIGRKVKPNESQEEQRKVGKDVARFFYLMRSHDTTFDFDLDLAERQSDENPVFYVQYAHARICSILVKAKEAGLKAVPGDLSHPKELELIKKIADLPWEVQRCAEDYGVHRLTTYAIELARTFHHFYDACRVIQEDQPQLTAARLALCEATKTGLQGVFRLLGIEAPERMDRAAVETP